MSAHHEAPPFSVLLVDDDLNICRTLALSLREADCRVVTASSVNEATQCLTSTPFELVITDYKLNGQTGLEVIAQAKKLQPSAFVVVMTAYSSIENAVEVIRDGAFDYLPKPFTNTQLHHAINKVRTFFALKSENHSLKRASSRSDFFAGFTSPPSRETENFIRAVAPTDATILLSGESGTGKSELAKYIHDRSLRNSLPLVTVYCTTLTETLVESELFGHTRGAFTGAVKDRVGKLELAHRGTLFLDEVGDLSLSSQAKLLRFLQERVFERVGSNREMSVDTRVIAATNRDLPCLVREGKFREDLYYRLNTLECCLTPLRERRDDLPVFISRIAQEILPTVPGLAHWGLPSDIQQVLLRYSWPGNIRELRNVLQRLLILSQSKTLEIVDLPSSLLLEVNLRPVPSENLTDERSRDLTLEELEKKHIESILTQEKSLERASQLLGITTVTLWRKRKQYGLI